MTVRRNSLDAYYGTVVPDLNKKQLQILKVMQGLGKDVTNQDLYAITMQPNNSVAPRTGELRDKGYIEKVGDRTINRRSHTLYRVTEKGMQVNTDKIPDILPKKRHYTYQDYFNICTEIKTFSYNNSVDKAMHEVTYQTLIAFLNSVQA